MRPILVLDSNPFVLRFCQMVLGKAGYPVISCEAPLEGLKALESQDEFAAILMDVGFDNPSTAALLQGLERRSKTCNFPIVLMSPSLESAQAFEAEFPAVLAWLRKPLLSVHLLETVQRLTKGNTLTEIRTRRSQRESAAPSVNRLEGNNQQANPAYPKLDHPPALMGRIEFMPVGEIFQMLRFQNKTGVFHVQKENQEIFVFFENGQIQLATARNVSHEFHLGRALLQKRVLKPALLNKILNQRRAQGSLLGEYLVNAHYIDEKFLHLALTHQTSGLVYEMVRWKAGSFTFISTPSLPQVAQKARLNLSVDELVLEGYRRLDEWDRLEREIGPAKTILVRNAQSTALLEHLSPAEKSILQMINGSLTLEEISERVLLPSYDVYQTCRELVAKNMVRRLAHQETRHPTFDA